ncbi:hypothetical protein ACLI09_03760 [Flavobacterium sp. RHBU_24]|uniref:hypothetical protein n=1 Tax=Flavobacterium sp. RHBU_24 TaxID=3391185 RepID=UPI003984AB32
MKIPARLLFLCLLIRGFAFSQAFVTVDNDTFEIVENVNYALYKDKQVVLSGITSKDTATFVDEKTEFDSIAFSRVDYESKGFLRKHWDSVVFLSKKTIYLDEVVIGRKKDKEVILGETNRFVKRRSRQLSSDLEYGLVIANGSPQKLMLDKVAFYVEKVKFKTAYRINFTEFREHPVAEGREFAEAGDIVYATDTLYLNPKDKGRVEVVLPEAFYLAATKKLFVWVQLLSYYDAGGAVVVPEDDNRTKLKFQLSEKSSFYSKTRDLNTKELSKDMINMNEWLTFDFATMFFTTPHKSDLVAPAIVLYAHKVEMKPAGISNKL